MGRRSTARTWGLSSNRGGGLSDCNWKRFGIDNGAIMWAVVEDGMRE